MIILDGKYISEILRKELKQRIDCNSKSSKTFKYQSSSPHLAVILVGDDPASKVYIRQKEKACVEVGIKFTLFRMTSNVETQDVLNQINHINSDKQINGLLVQLPLPNHLNEQLIIDSISAEKDVDGFHPTNIGKLLLNRKTFKPATPYGIELLLKWYQIPTKGKHCVVLGKSLIVGQPLANLLSLEQGMGATVTMCDKNTTNMSEIVKLADILIVATGKHHIINNPEWLKQGVTIIDVGIHRMEDPNEKRGYRLEGDVDFHNPEIQSKCEYMTPVPGGVGPMTVLGLLENTYQAFRNQ